jgi:penicillin-binding protein 1A
MTLTQALALSINTIAVKLSLKVGREKVIETLKKVGINNVQRSCSMALGDQGITVIDHTAGYAVFANGGKPVRPYAIIEIRNQRDEVVYSHDLNEPKPQQVFERSVIEQMNQMQEQVVLAGTGRAAQLDFTHVAGKTGTSSSYRDAWFIGYTGQYVTGVWYGNDSFTPMNRVTGGSLPAQTWKLYNVGAHVSMNIPQIPGLPVHPRQLEEQQRLSEIRRDDPTLGTVAEALQTMPARTKKILESLNKIFRETPKLDETDTPTSRGAMIAPSAAGRLQ